MPIHLDMYNSLMSASKTKNMQVWCIQDRVPHHGRGKRQAVVQAVDWIARKQGDPACQPHRGHEAEYRYMHIPPDCGLVHGIGLNSHASEAETLCRYLVRDSLGLRF